MESERIEPIATELKRPGLAARGRPIDLIAAGLAGVSAILSALLMLFFFSGFVANDPTLGKAISAAIFSLFLGSFAIIPAFLISVIAFRGWKRGLSAKSAFWAFGLSLPWLMLSVVVFLKAPLPSYIPVLAIILSLFLCLWAGASLILVLRKSQTASRKSDNE